MKNFTKTSLAILSLLIWCSLALNAQTFTFSTAGTTAIPDATYNGTLATMGSKAITVVGLPATGTISNIRVTVATVNHTWIGDLTMKLFTNTSAVFGCQSRAGLIEAVDGAGQCCGWSTDLVNATVIYTDAGINSAENMGQAGNVTGTTSWLPNKGIIVSPYTTFASLGAALGANPSASNGVWNFGIGDGAGGDIGNFGTVTLEITVAAPFVPCVMTCPANISVNLDPGACEAIVSYPLPTLTGDCFTGSLVNGFQQVFAPSAINYYQYDAGIFTNPPTPFTNAYAVSFNSPTNTTLTLISADFGFSPGPNIFFFNGCEWINTTGAPANVSFNWTYNTNDGAFWDQFQYLIGTAANNFANNNFGNQLANWTGISNDAGANSQMGALAIVIPANGRLALSAFTQDAGVGPCTIVVSNFVVSAILPSVPVLTSGLPPGSTFPIGTTANCYSVTANNAQGVPTTSTCCFNVTIAEYPNPTTTLACNDNVQVSVDSTCTAFISTDMILEGGPYHCYDDYLVTVEGYGSGYGGVTIDNGAIGQTLFVTILDPDTGNSCWGTISVEDKIPPTIECRDVTIMCGAQLPTDPAPPLVGPQEQCITGLNDLLELNTFDYEFDYSYLPPTPVLDVDCRVFLDDHTWHPDINIQIIAPSGFIQSIYQIGGCFGAEFPINVIFDDEGIGGITQCVDINQGPISCFQAAGRIQPFQLPGVQATLLDNLDGEQASGLWTVRISDNAAGDDGHIMEVGLAITVNLPQVDPTDNCGEVDVTFTDSESGDPCEGLIVTRHWVATDGSGNTATCDQQITVIPLNLDSVACPPAFEGPCGDSSDPDNTGWPTVNGNPITDEENVCNIFVGYWDLPLNDCGSGVKIVRTWTILDWCTQTTVECVQVIKLSDNEAPELTCPEDFEVGTDFWYCYANVSVPKPDVFDACGSAYTLSLTASAGIIINFGNNFVINQLPIGTHTVTWHVVDECGNSSSCSFEITVVDDVVPVANCDAHTIVALTNDGPFGITLVPAEVFDDGSYDNCGPVTFRVRRMDSCIDFDWTTEGACIDHIPGGIPPVNSRDRGTVHRPCAPFACCDVGAPPVMVELEVTDVAGNRNYCMVEVVVQDKISPFIECPPDIIVSCDFWFNVQEGTFEDEAGNANGNLDEDPLSVIFGNMYDAFAYNDDESVRQDIIIDDPGSDIQPQPHFWGIDGWADDNCEVNLQVRVRVVADCSGGDLPGNAPEGAVKLIERRFSASDGNDGVAPGTCTQRIWVVDFEPFYIDDNTCNNNDPNDGVIWPCDVLLTDCPEDLGDTGEPTIFDDACSLIGVAYEDTRFDFVDGACFKILRRWAVIDWCQYDPITGAGLWYYTQVIKVHDEEGPEFLECPIGPVTLCVADTGVSLPDNNQAFLGEDNPLASSCSVHLNLTQTVHDACSDFINYDVKLYLFNGDEFIYLKTLTTTPADSNNDAVLSFDTRQNPSLQIRLNGIPYNSQFCGDYHRILWSAEDGCGNWSHCEYLLRLEDCKQPSPVCINGLSTVVMPIGGQVTIWASDFDASSFDDCTPAADLLFSFTDDHYSPSYTYTCDNVPAFGVELSVAVWVADAGTDDNCNGLISWDERNIDYCTTTIVITDNEDVCSDTTGSILAGEILTEDIQAVELVTVKLSSPGHVFPTFITTQNGQFNFNHIILPLDISIAAERDDQHRNGVSTLDLVRIQKHLLGIEPLSSPYDVIAADANNSESVSAIDLVELRRLILGLYVTLPNNKSWRFVDKSFLFADVSHPWPFDEVIDIHNLIGNQMGRDFVAVKVGDVNNTVQAHLQQVHPRNGGGIVHFTADDLTVKSGEMVAVAIRSSDFTSIEGYQFTLTTQGLEFRGVEGGMIDMKDENIGVFESMLTASWHKVGGVSATSNDVLFTLHFQATNSGHLSEMINLNSKETQAEAYNTSEDIKDLKLSFRGAESGAEFALYQNEPNPFKGNTVIGYDVPQSGSVTLTVFDITGKIVVVKNQDAVKGYNTITVNSKELPALGVMYYKLQAGEYSATKKMVIIE